jgi:hypothetical protein
LIIQRSQFVFQKLPFEVFYSIYQATMKILSLALFAIAVQADQHHGLRGVNVEDEEFYQRFLQNINSIATGAPTTPLPSPTTMSPTFVGQTYSPTASPSSSASPSFSASPTGQPSESPSSAPTQCIPPPNCPSVCAQDDPPTICSPECIACPPQLCDINISIEPNCPSIPCEWNVCKESPFRLEFVYRGGDCASSEFRRCTGENPDLCTCEKEILSPEDWPNELECQDFNGGPPSKTQTGTISWIKAQASSTSLIYFEGAVRVGSNFNATSSGDSLDDNIVLFVYEYDEAIQGPGKFLQQIVFHSSCSQELYLADTFGAAQLVEFESPTTLVSLFRDQEFTFNVTLAMESSAIELDLLTSDVVLLSSSPVLGPQLNTLPVSGTKIPPSLVIEAAFKVIPQINHTVIASVGGLLDGVECNALSQETFNCPIGG